MFPPVCLTGGQSVAGSAVSFAVAVAWRATGEGRLVVRLASGDLLLSSTPVVAFRQQAWSSNFALSSRGELLDKVILAVHLASGAVESLVLLSCAELLEKIPSPSRSAGEACISDFYLCGFVAFGF
ncbi:gamma-glutamyltransferase [Sesbania bispinosa]|nr:gamma-glutamyltransferase [Sesbania bispinosa]